jgi:hypothetical protein
LKGWHDEARFHDCAGAHSRESYLHTEYRGDFYFAWGCFSEIATPIHARPLAGRAQVPSDTFVAGATACPARNLCGGDLDCARRTRSLMAIP